MPEPGLSATIEELVTAAMTAERVGSGDVPVLATPAVLAVVERAAVAAVASSLAPGATTVGTRVELDHVAPTPIGAKIRTTARLERVNGRKLAFAFQVEDTTGVVARGTHLRVVVDRVEFLRKITDRI